MNALLRWVLVAAVVCWMTAAHWQHIDIGKADEKVRLHEQVLAGDAKDPYQYKLWIIEHGVAKVQAWTQAPLQHVWMGNTLLSLLFLVLAHYVWLRRGASATVALVGTLLLGALGNTLFLIYYHHTYEFWGVGLFCLLLVAIDRDVAWWKLALLCLVTGLVWEKHLLLAGLWGLLQLVKRRPFFPSLAKGLVILACAVAVPVFVRWHLGVDRGHVDGDTPLHVQDLGKIAWFQAPYILPFLLMFLVTWKRQSAFLRLLWLYLPALVAAYLFQQYIVHEVRSFWALAPVFTATACVWFERYTDTHHSAHLDPVLDDPWYENR